MLNWAGRFNVCCFFDNHKYGSPHHTYECILAAGAAKVFKPSGDFFASLSAFNTSVDDWIFGHFNYDIKNRIEHLHSNHPDHIGFPESFLFVPEAILNLVESTVTIGVLNADALHIFNEILKEEPVNESSAPVNIKCRITKEEYIATLQQLLHHIHRGDCYEINYCQEFFAKDAVINPLSVYQNLAAVSPNPFCAYYKVYDKHLMCASPERYLKKTGTHIISQPIKGTAARAVSDTRKDEFLKDELYKSKKDRSEHVMAVDMVRNDLSRICRDGSVKVEELFKIYTFPQVHQMISTISGELRDEIDVSGILKATFPMASMTGAPKKKVMELIELYEKCTRGIFSGTIGYISPEKDMDLNVVIRSIMYNESKQYLSYQVGGGITDNSDPEKEYEECLLKAAAIKEVLSQA